MYKNNSLHSLYHINNGNDSSLSYLYFHSPSACENTYMFMKYLTIVYADHAIRII